MQEESDPVCLSFSCYSTDRLADVAVKVTREFQDELKSNQQIQHNNDDDQFEFISVSGNFNHDASATESTEESPIGPVFPLFNRDLLLDYNRENRGVNSHEVASSIRQPLKKLFIDDRDHDASSTSSEEADAELEGIEPGTYCVWAPKSSIEPSPSPDRCKKSNSTGNSSSRWRFLRDLLKRSHSDGGKDSFVLVSTGSSSKTDKRNDLKEKKKSPDEGIKVNVNAKAKAKVSTPPHPQALYVRNKTAIQGDKKKRKSYLPYRTFLASFPI